MFSRTNKKTDVKLITPFDPWKNSLCSCAAKYSLSAYTGCSHGCIYCYASGYVRNFWQPREKKYFLARLQKDLPALDKNSTIAMANSSDPYQPMEKKLRLTRQALRLLAERGARILLVTKSDLIARDLDIFRGYKKIVAALTIATMDKNLAAKLEPGAPEPDKRLKALEKLAKHIPVICRVDPLFYGINTGGIPELLTRLKNCGCRQITVSTYKSRPDNFSRVTKVFPQLKKIYLEQGEKIGNSTYLGKDLRKKLLDLVSGQAKTIGLRFAACREGLEKNTCSCDGADFLR